MPGSEAGADDAQREAKVAGGREARTRARAGDGRSGMTCRRIVATGEVTLFVGSILAFIWVVQPATGHAVHITCYLLMLGFAWLSAMLHGDSYRDVGLRFDNFRAAARLVMPITFALMLGVGVVGLALGTRLRAGALLAVLPPYLLWALVQQYALQAVVQRRLWDAGLDKHAPLLAAVLFALTHLPNPGLTALTFVAGWMWATFYRRCPNLIVLAISHALLAATVVAALPDSFTGRLRVGPGYWH